MHLMIELSNPLYTFPSSFLIIHDVISRKLIVGQFIISRSYSSTMFYSSGYTCFHIKSDVFWMTNIVVSFCIDCLFSRVLLHWSCFFEKIACFCENCSKWSLSSIEVITRNSQIYLWDCMFFRLFLARANHYSRKICKDLRDFFIFSLRNESCAILACC